jgi:hypothetical protein
MHPGLIRLALAAILPAIALGGCAMVASVNARVDRVRPEAGYRIAKFMVRDRGPANNPDALVLLAFSGGGTRAAALSYGVLEELRRTPIMVKGHQHSLLDEVDPTTFFLPPESIDRLRELGGRLLRNSHPYKILLQRIGELAKRDTPSPVQPPAR